MIAIGLIAGRHDMPVDRYLLPADITQRVGFGQELYNAAYEAAVALAQSGSEIEVKLYITGLTIAAMGAVKGLLDGGCKVVVMTYDTPTESYKPVTVH